MPKRGDAATVPILGASVHQKHFRLLTWGHARAQSIALTSNRIRGGLISNRKLGLRERPELVGLREPLVEAPQARCAGLDEERVDRLAPLLVGGEALVNQMSLVSSSLRRAKSVHKLAPNDGVGIVLERRGQVSNRGESQPSDRRILRLIVEF